MYGIIHTTYTKPHFSHQQKGPSHEQNQFPIPFFAERSLLVLAGHQKQSLCHLLELLRYYRYVYIDRYIYIYGDTCYVHTR